CITDCEYLVNYYDLKIEVRGNCECKTNIHSAAESFRRCIDEFVDSGESDDFVEFPPYLVPCHSQHSAAQENILAPRQLGMEAGANLQQTADPAAQTGLPTAGFGDAAQDLQQRRLARPVAAD